MIDFKEIEYKPFGRCISVNDGTAELYATLDIGPRIIRFAPCGGENIFGENTNFDLKEPADEEYAKFGDLGKWHNFGGHRLWTSPEVMPRSYFPDNFPCEYKIEGNTLSLYQIKQPYTNIQLSMELTFEGGGVVTVRHFVKNIGAWDSELAPWSITVMSRGGTELFPQRTGGPTFLPNRVMSMWTYTRLNDKRVHFLDKYVFLDQTDDAHPFKIGMNNTDGFAVYFNHGDAFIKYFEYDENKTYPDGGCNFETYTDDGILEIESLGELKRLAPGETAAHTEKWKIVSGVSAPEKTDEAAADFVKKYI